MTFNNNKFVMLSTSISNNQKFLLFCLVLIFYFLWMDIGLFLNLQKWLPQSVEKNLIDKKIKEYSIDSYGVYKPLSVKLIMVDHPTHYIHDVLSRFIVDTLHFSKLFPWITPNLVSFFGLGLAIIGSKLILSDNLFYRQIGAIFFEFRNLADAMDGVVFRSHKREKTELLRKSLDNNTQYTEEILFASTHGTVGKIIR